MAPGHELDGQSLLPLAEATNLQARREILLENRRSSAIRTDRYLYVEHDLRRGRDPEAIELYDKLLDPHQLESVHEDPIFAEVRQTLARELRALRRRAGPSCRRTAPVATSTHGATP